MSQLVSCDRRVASMAYTSFIAERALASSLGDCLVSLTPTLQLSNISWPTGFAGCTSNVIPEKKDILFIAIADETLARQ